MHGEDRHPDAVVLVDDPIILEDDFTNRGIVKLFNDPADFGIITKPACGLSEPAYERLRHFWVTVARYALADFP